MKNFYEILNLPENADESAIREPLRIFQERISRFNNGLMHTPAEIEIQYPDWWKAYATLSDPVRRNEYDLQLEAMRQRSVMLHPVEQTTDSESQDTDITPFERLLAVLPVPVRYILLIVFLSVTAWAIVYLVTELPFQMI